MRNTVKWVFAGVMAIGFGGCYGGDEPPLADESGNPPPQAGGEGGGLPPVVEPPLADGRCHALDGNAAPMIMDRFATSLPTLLGGALADGTYVLTSYEWYHSKARLHHRKIVLELSSGGRVAKYYWKRNDEPEERMTGTVAVESSRIAIRGSCPAGKDLEWDRYHVNGGTLMLFSTRDSKSATFTRQ